MDMEEPNKITVYDAQKLAVIVSELTKSGVSWQIETFLNLPSKWTIHVLQ